MRPILDATNEEIRAIHAYLAITNPAGRGGGGGRGRGGGRGLRFRRDLLSRAACRVRCRRVAAVLPRRRRHRRQHAVARGRRSREAADAVSERLQRDGVVNETALHDDHRVRPEHGRSSGRCRTATIPPQSITAARATDLATPVGSARETAWSLPRRASCFSSAKMAGRAPTTSTPAKCCGKARPRADDRDSHDAHVERTSASFHIAAGRARRRRRRGRRRHRQRHRSAGRSARRHRLRAAEEVNQGSGSRLRVQVQVQVLQARQLARTQAARLGADMLEQHNQSSCRRSRQSRHCRSD